MLKGISVYALMLIIPLTVAGFIGSLFAGLSPDGSLFTMVTPWWLVKTLAAVFVGGGYIAFTAIILMTRRKQLSSTVDHEELGSEEIEVDPLVEPISAVPRTGSRDNDIAPTLTLPAASRRGDWER